MTKTEFKNNLDKGFKESVKAGRHLVHINDEWCLEISYMGNHDYGVDVRRYGWYIGKNYHFKEKDYNRFLSNVSTWIWNRTPYERAREENVKERFCDC